MAERTRKMTTLRTPRAWSIFTRSWPTTSKTPAHSVKEHRLQITMAPPSLMPGKLCKRAAQLCFDRRRRNRGRQTLSDETRDARETFFSDGRLEGHKPSSEITIRVLSLPSYITYSETGDYYMGACLDQNRQATRVFASTRNYRSRWRLPQSDKTGNEGAIPPQRRRTTRAPSRLRDDGPRGRHPASETCHEGAIPPQRHATRVPSRLRDDGPRGRHPASETADHEGAIPPQRRRTTRAPSRLRDMPRGRHPASETTCHEGAIPPQRHATRAPSRLRDDMPRGRLRDDGP